MAEAARSPVEPSDEARAEPIELALGPGMAFVGLLVLPKAARIDGRVGGKVLAGGPVWVGPSGQVDADLEADTMVVEGRVNGSLRARHAIALGPTAVVSGDLATPRLRVAEGALIDGRCACGDRDARGGEAAAAGTGKADRGLGAS